MTMFSSGRNWAGSTLFPRNQSVTRRGPRSPTFLCSPAIQVKGRSEHNTGRQFRLLQIGCVQNLAEIRRGCRSGVPARKISRTKNIEHLRLQFYPAPVADEDWARHQDI